ncbi:MAG: hypothetical protein V4579_06595 [Pseudomonadota bacterium]
MPSSPTGKRRKGADAPDPAIPAGPVGGPKPDKRFSGRNEGVSTGRPTEDDRLGKRHHDGWNSNT